MTKKIFAQPEMMVVGISKNDVIATSFNVYSDQTISDPGQIKAPGMRDWDAGY